MLELYKILPATPNILIINYGHERLVIAPKTGARDGVIHSRPINGLSGNVRKLVQSDVYSKLLISSKTWRKFAHGQIASRIGFFIPGTASLAFTQPQRILSCFLCQLHIVNILLISTEGVMRFSSKIGVESLAHIYNALPIIIDSTSFRNCVLGAEVCNHVKHIEHFVKY